MWDVPVITDRAILANWPDIALHDKKQKTCLLIDIAIQHDININTKETERLSKVQRPGDQGQQDVETEDKNCASNNCSVNNN